MDKAKYPSRAASAEKESGYDLTGFIVGYVINGLLIAVFIQ